MTTTVKRLRYPTAEQFIPANLVAGGMRSTSQFSLVFATGFGLGLGASAASHFPVLSIVVAESRLGNSENNPGPRVDPIDLGVVESGGKRTAITWLRNTGRESVEVQQVTTSCDCLTVRIAEHRLAPGDRTPVRIDFDDSNQPGFTGFLSVEVHSLDMRGEHSSLGTLDLEICGDRRVTALVFPRVLNSASNLGEP